MHIKEINIKNRVYNYYFDNLMKAKKKKIEIKKNLIDEKNYMDLVIYFTRYIHKEPVKMLSICYHELMGKTEEHEGKKCFMVDD